MTFEDKNNDGVVQYVADPEFNELDVDRDIMVLANPEIANLPNWVIALVAAGGLAAALSTAAGLLLVISSAISHDLLKKTFMPEINDKQELIFARFAAFFAVCIAGYFGIYPPGFVASVVAIAFGYAAASFFPALIMGIFSKRMNKEGAIAGLIAGLGFTTFYVLKFKLSEQWNLGPILGSNSPEDWWLGISPEGIGFIGMIINFVVAIVVSSFTAPPPEEVQELVENIRIPSGAGEATH